MFFWVCPRRQSVICRRFGTMYQFHLQRLEVDTVYFQPLKMELIHGSETSAYYIKTKLMVLYMFFWVCPRRQSVICRRFGTMYQFHLQRLEVDTVYFQPLKMELINGSETSAYYTILKSRRKLEIYKQRVFERKVLRRIYGPTKEKDGTWRINPLKPELNSICYLLALLGTHHFLHVSRIRVKLLTLR